MGSEKLMGSENNSRLSIATHYATQIGGYCLAVYGSYRLGASVEADQFVASLGLMSAGGVSSYVGTRLGLERGGAIERRLIAEEKSDELKKHQENSEACREVAKWGSIGAIALGGMAYFSQGLFENPLIYDVDIVPPFTYAMAFVSSLITGPMSRIARGGGNRTDQPWMHNMLNIRPSDENTKL